MIRIRYSLRDDWLSGKSWLLLILVCMGFYSSCSLPGKSNTDLARVTFEKVWFSSSQDLDQDGYFSRAVLYFIPRLDRTVQVMNYRLYYRPAGNEETSESTLLLYSEQNAVLGGAGQDTVKIFLGLPGQELNQNIYNFYIRVYNPQAPGFLLAEANPSNYPQLGNLRIESDQTDARLTIEQVRLVEAKDYDDDGFASHLKAEVDLFCSRLNSSADLIIEAVPGNQNQVIPLDTLFHILITDSVRTRPVDLYLNHLNHDLYDLRFSVRFTDYLVIEDVMDRNRNPDLGNQSLESFAEEIPQMLTLSYLNETTFTGKIKHDTGSLDLAEFAVRFDQPDAAILGRIKRIRVHVADEENYIVLKAWRENGGAPGQEINVIADRKFLTANEWNIFYVDLDVSEIKSFFIGYRQTSFSGPYISLDQTPPHSRRSYKRDPSTGSWILIPEADLAIEVVFEYFTEN